MWIYKYDDDNIYSISYVVTGNVIYLYSTVLYVNCVYLVCLYKVYVYAGMPPHISMSVMLSGILLSL